MDKKTIYGSKQHKIEMDILKSASLEIYYNTKKTLLKHIFNRFNQIKHICEGVTNFTNCDFKLKLCFC